MELIDRHCHGILGHCGQKYVLSSVRQKFSHIKGRTTVRKVLKNCFKCKLPWKSSSIRTKDGRSSRRQSHIWKATFFLCWSGLFWAIYGENSQSIVKRYGVLFTCLSIHVVHIEVVHTLDTDAFINALKRFVARLGKPVQMRSDNGGNFVKEDKELREAIGKWNQKEFHDFLLQNSVD